ASSVRWWRLVPILYTVMEAIRLAVCPDHMSWASTSEFSVRSVNVPRTSSAVACGWVEELPDGVALPGELDGVALPGLPDGVALPGELGRGGGVQVPPIASRCSWLASARAFSSAARSPSASCSADLACSIRSWVALTNSARALSVGPGVGTGGGGVSSRSPHALRVTSNTSMPAPARSRRGQEER